MGKASDLEPTDRTEPLKAKIIKEEESLSAIELAERKEKFKDFMRNMWLNKLNRGWKGSESIIGRYIPTIGSQDAMNEFGRTFDDYKVVILNLGRVSAMAPKLGRLYKVRTTVMVGNCKGFYGMATVQTEDHIEGLILARREAFRNLEYHRLHEGRTIEADVFHHYHKYMDLFLFKNHVLLRTSLHLLKQPKGYGIRSSQLLRRVCHLIGLKDIHIIHRGSDNVLMVINCMLRALHDVKLADDLDNQVYIKFRFFLNNFV